MKTYRPIFNDKGQGIQTEVQTTSRDANNFKDVATDLYPPHNLYTDREHFSFPEQQTKRSRGPPP